MEWIKELELGLEKITNKDDNFETGFYEGQIYFAKLFSNLDKEKKK